jgi:hypothetical protein
MFNRAEARFYQGGGFVDLTGNGRIDGDFFDPLSPTGEQYMAWRDLRTAGFWPGEAAHIGLAAMPENLFGGVMGFAATNLGLSNVVCLTDVPGPSARALDARMDDGVIDTGAVRGRIRRDGANVRNVFPDPDTAPYADGDIYMICRQWQS